MSRSARTLAAIALLAIMASPAVSQDQAPEPMGFFITSVGPGNGADLGGLAGADAHCQALAEAVGAGDRTWRAYLSTQATDGSPAINARDRIGTGPWANADGLTIATNVDELHYNNANIRYEYALNERGETVNSGALGDSPSYHDILTGTRLDGTAFPPGEDRTCSNWTSRGAGSAMVGHHDRYRFTTPGSPWNEAHGSRGCTTTCPPTSTSPCSSPSKCSASAPPPTAWSASPTSWGSPAGPAGSRSRTGSGTAERRCPHEHRRSRPSASCAAARPGRRAWRQGQQRALRDGRSVRGSAVLRASTRTRSRRWHRSRWPRWQNTQRGYLAPSL